MDLEMNKLQTPLELTDDEIGQISGGVVPLIVPLAALTVATAAFTYQVGRDYYQNRNKRR